ncbi:MAG: amidohydrolase family protein, partial [Clostridia bacterium]|nr:amidohydrolase family protein [Clostridia bacterium]
MDMLIRGANIYDGSGEKPFLGDVYLRSGKIAAVGTNLPVPENTPVLEAEGRMLCPGFVDIHRHADVKPLMDWNAEAELRQGITTMVSGNCGISLTPAGDAYAAEQYAFASAVIGPVQAETVPKSYRAYRKTLENKALPLYFAAMIGTGAVRISIKGFSPAPFTAAELEKAEACIEEALALGAPGISCGIMYMPECFNTIEEYTAMLRPLGRYKRPLTAHIRGEGIFTGNGDFDGIDRIAVGNAGTAGIEFVEFIGERMARLGFGEGEREASDTEGIGFSEALLPRFGVLEHEAEAFGADGFITGIEHGLLHVDGGGDGFNDAIRAGHEGIGDGGSAIDEDGQRTGHSCQAKRTDRDEREHEGNYAFFHGAHLLS